MDTGQQYQLELKNRFDAFTEVDHPETMYKDIVEIVAESAQKVITNMPKRRSKKLVSDTTLTLFTNRDNVKMFLRRKQQPQKKDGKVLQNKCKSPTLRIISVSWKDKQVNLNKLIDKVPQDGIGI